MAGIESGQLTNYNNKIQLLGGSSGLNIQGLIEAQMQMEALKIDPYYTTRDYYSQEKTQWGSFKTQLSKVLSLAEGIKNLTDVNQASSYSKEGFVQATAKGDSIPGKYNITVEKLAMAHKLMSDAAPSSTNPLGYQGNLNIDGKTIEVKTTMSLTDIAKEINKSDALVDATVVGGHLFLTSQKTGAASAIDIQSVGGGNQVTSSDSTKIGVAVTGDITTLNPQYNLEVQQLAKAHKVESNTVLNQSNVLNYTGSFNINGKTINVATTDKLSDIVTKINGDAAIGVKASIVNNKLVLESKTTGEANSITLTDATSSIDRPEGLFQHIGMTDGMDFKNVTQAASDAQYTIDGVGYTSSTNTSTDIAGLSIQLKAVTSGPVQLNLTTGGMDIATSLGLITGAGAVKNELQQGQDAMYTIEGVSRTSETNTITDAVQDMTFELLKETTEPIEITVTQNDEALTTKMKEFVDAYNKTILFINENSKEGSVFQGENLMRNAKTALRSILYDSGLNGMMMFEIGIEGDGLAKDGTIKFNETKFKEALNGNYENVITFLTGETGIANKFYDKINEFTKTTGMIDTKTESLDRSIKTLDKTIERKELMYERTQERLVKTYSALEGLLARMNSQSSFISSQLSTLSGSKE